MVNRFLVIGEYRYPKILLQSDIISFEKNSKLILSPDEDFPNAQRTLTIIADKIEIDDHAEITYDLDHVLGIDPENPPLPKTSTSPSGRDGVSYSNASEGNYPHAEDGGPGTSGYPGEKGTPGMDAPSIEIWVREVTPGEMKINFRGQQGGMGGNGGNGGNGGDGQKGAHSTSADSWYNGNECAREPGLGGDGGRGGDAGNPGEGGDGGNGGIIKVFTVTESQEIVKSWQYLIQGGKGGSPGNPGQPGMGGKGGKQGDRVDPCPERTEFRGKDKENGRTMSQIDPKWQQSFRGKKGTDGDYAIYEITNVPK